MNNLNPYILILALTGLSYPKKLNCQAVNGSIMVEESPNQCSPSLVEITDDDPDFRILQNGVYYNFRHRFQIGAPQIYADPVSNFSSPNITSTCDEGENGGYEEVIVD